MIRLRQVNPERWRMILDPMQHECFPGDDPCPYRDGDHWWLAFDGQDAVGFACVRPLPNEPLVWYMARAGVTPQARGNGLQRRMIRVRINAARKAGGTHVLTDCTASNPASANNLIATGFRVFTPGYAWALKNSIYWRLKL